MPNLKLHHSKINQLIFLLLNSHCSSEPLQVSPYLFQSTLQKLESVLQEVLTAPNRAQPFTALRQKKFLTHDITTYIFQYGVGFS